MSVKWETCWTAVCDVCGNVLEQDYVAHHDSPENAAGHVRDYDWTVTDDGSRIVCDTEDEEHEGPRAEVSALYDAETGVWERERRERGELYDTWARDLAAADGIDYAAARAQVDRIRDELRAALAAEEKKQRRSMIDSMTYLRADGSLLGFTGRRGEMLTVFVDQLLVEQRQGLNDARLLERERWQAHVARRVRVAKQREQLMAAWVITPEQAAEMLDLGPQS